MIYKLLNFLNVSKITKINISNPCNITNKIGNFSYFENYLNKYLLNIRFSKNFRHDKIMQILICIKFSYKVANRLNKNRYLFMFNKITRLNKINLKLDYDSKRKLYNKYFAGDIEKLELLLNKDLSDWKY